MPGCRRTTLSSKAVSRICSGASGRGRKAIEINPAFAEGYFYLAKFCLDAGRLDEAAFNARKGLEIGTRSEFAPLGHYVLADVYSRQGRHAEAAREAAKGKELEGSGKRR